MTSYQSTTRQPYWQLHVRGVPSEIVLGRKYCPGCGRWRHLCDFPRDTRQTRYGFIRPRCEACGRIGRNYYSRHLAPEKLTNRRERQRFYKEGVRRKAGIPETTARKRTVIDRDEKILLAREPLLRELERCNGELPAILDRAGVPERSIYRIRNESKHLRLDTADRLAVAMGVPLALIYPEGR